jgi:hypothetical protein
MLKQVLLISGSSIFVLLGVAHLYYTFINNKFKARDAAVTEAMKNTQPVLTRQTTMWKGWIVFNGSHSLGVIFFGGVNIILGTQYYQVISSSIILQALNIVVCGGYLLLAVKYWFKTPLLGIAAATACFVLSAIL